MHSSKHQDKTEPKCSEQSNLCRPEETTYQSQEAKLIEHLKQIADEGEFMELST